jgi:hypothetical protein
MDLEVKEASIRDGATIICVNRQVVQFYCKCGAHHEKLKRAICKTSGAFCKSCTDRNTNIKRLTHKITQMNALLEGQDTVNQR